MLVNPKVSLLVVDPENAGRFLDVLAAFVAAGGSVADAAARVGVRPSTVKRHLADLSRDGLYAGRGGSPKHACSRRLGVDWLGPRPDCHQADGPPRIGIERGAASRAAV
jgi:IclR helix-turn-helix domain